MKSVTMTLALAATLALAVQAASGAATTTPPAKAPAAQVGATPPARGAWAGKLGLTDEQRTQIQAILKDAREHARTAADRAAKMQIMKAAFEKIKTTVLTDEQRQKLDQFKAKRQAHRPFGPGSPMKGPRPVGPRGFGPGAPAAPPAKS
jgi:Spy/CpxP family protein refolding chaperone